MQDKTTKPEKKEEPVVIYMRHLFKTQKLRDFRKSLKS